MRESTVIDTATCFFDVFPVHPQPEPMESFTGYLTRLGEANRMPTIGELFITAFPNTSYQPPDATRVLNDYSTLAFGTLPQASMCSETTLRATTLFHFGKKFGRLPLPQTLRGFFQGSVAPHRRYCPLCLAEHSRPHYSLLWQFLCIPGCVSHECHFLEECGHCGQRLPLLPSRPSITTCPMCRGDLRISTPSPLSREERKKSRGKEKENKVKKSSKSLINYQAIQAILKTELQAEADKDIQIAVCQQLELLEAILEFKLLNKKEKLNDKLQKS